MKDTTSQAIAKDHLPTVCAIAMLAFMLGDLLHEGVGHGLVALLTVARSGRLTTVDWTAAHDSRLVAAGGTLVNLVSAALFWLLLKSARSASARVRYFLLLACAFNLFSGTGYLFFSGVTNLGDWAEIIAGAHRHGLWRALLMVVGIVAYWGAALAIGTGMVRYVGVPRGDGARLRPLTFAPYFSAVLLALAAGGMNPSGWKLVLLSALPATAGADSGLLWMRYYVGKGPAPERASGAVNRSWLWMAVAGVAALIFIFVVGRGITLQR